MDNRATVFDGAFRDNPTPDISKLAAKMQEKTKLEFGYSLSICLFFHYLITELVSNVRLSMKAPLTWTNNKNIHKVFV